MLQSVPTLYCLLFVWCRSDNGAASFLGEAVAAVRAMVDASQWQLESVPRVHLAQEVALAEAQGSDLPALQAPQQAPVQLPEGATPALVSAGFLLCYAPLGQLVGCQPTCGLWPAPAHASAAPRVLRAAACRLGRWCWRPSPPGASSTC